MKKIIITLFFLLFFFQSAYAGMLIGSGSVGSSGPDFTSVTFFMNMEGTFNDGANTYTMGGSEYSAGDSVGSESSGETVDITAGSKKIGSYGLYATAVNDKFLFDGTSLLSSSEYKIGFWFQVPSTWRDGEAFFVIYGAAGDAIFVTQETTGTNELDFYHQTGSGADISETSSTTMSTGVFYWVEQAAKASTNYFYWSISTDSAHEDIGTDTPSVTVDTFDGEPAGSDVQIGIGTTGGQVIYLDNVIFSTDSTKDLWSLRNETAYVAP